MNVRDDQSFKVSHFLDEENRINDRSISVDSFAFGESKILKTEKRVFFIAEMHHEHQKL